MNHKKPIVSIPFILIIFLLAYLSGIGCNCNTEDDKVSSEGNSVDDDDDDDNDNDNDDNNDNDNDDDVTPAENPAFIITTRIVDGDLDNPQAMLYRVAKGVPEKETSSKKSVYDHNSIDLELCMNNVNRTYPEVIAQPARFGKMQCKDDGTIVMTYKDLTTLELVLIEDSTGVWNRTVLSVLDQPFFSLSVDYDFVIDSAQNMHVVYSNNQSTYYMTDVSGTWTTEIILDEYAFNQTLKVDSAGSAHLLFTSFDPAGILEFLTYANNEAGTWQSESIWTGFDNLFFGSTLKDSTLSIGPNDETVVEYLFKTYSEIPDYECISFSMRYRTTNPVSIQELIPFQTAFPSLAFDSNGSELLAFASDPCSDDYSAGPLEPVMFAERTGFWTWNSEIVDQASVRDMVMVIDPSGYAHIAFISENYTETIRYTNNITGNWTGFSESPF